MRKTQHAIGRAEQPGMARRPAQRKGVLVMHLAPQHPPPPVTELGRHRRAGGRAVAEPILQRPIAERRAGQPHDGNAEQDEIDVRIDWRAVMPCALQDKSAQAGRIVGTLAALARDG